MNSPLEQMRSIIRRCPYDSMHRDRVANDLLGISSSYQLNLRYVEQVDGIRVGTLCKLEGNLPVVITGQTYNIPIAIIFPEKYPAVAPLLYVCPTKNMRIKTSAYVNSAGQISHQSLTAWTMKSSLRQVLVELAAVFGQQCPVYVDARYQIQAQAVETANTRILDKYERLRAEATEECKNLESTKQQLQQHQRDLQVSLQSTQQSLQSAREKRLQLQTYSQQLEERLLHQAYPSDPEVTSNEIQPKDEWQAKMLKLVAEEMAIHDTLFVLEDLLTRKQSATEACFKELKAMYAKQFLVAKKEEKVERMILGNRK